MTEILNETETEVDGAEFAALADFVLTQMHVSSGAELNILFIDPEPMAELHKRWLDLEGPTDVMSFPMDELRPGTEDDPAEGVLGDICICPQVAQAQAQEAGHSAAEEMLMLATHGMLHLLGYDHAEPEEREEMFSLQRRLLLTFLATR
ncbi:MAG: rRNA maturation RNase YbeY [Actinomyces sp.]|nr:rRNA maturation RNase YbeY [Actinomyces sp.]MCI1641179.1 rRNA maturation RNase YbeY [Actinomyces sp.]MCI1663221.1 rRNA maturation RNase YbeY [Actinomyces sp.]MCI1691971.1 rRNA maturation RNase YbeY [Actinomyces sp.]MCI1786800.1 rRNA maturation RNase YbeY [Actinomyces sp.]MCI1829058.1 rRNA maturation RNase YbeY [Actinomyces sp.]